MKKHITQPTFRIQRPLLYTAILISLGLLSATPLLANPKGGVIVGGQGKITQTPGITTIDQTSRRAVINWKDFSIGQGELTRFNQPGKDAIALNRVLGKDPSNILGQLKANGHVWLVNPNGVLIGPDAQVDVQGLLATTADIADQDFLAGRYHFSIPSPNPDASVVNQGLITIGQHGFGGLVAPHVRNSGVITGRLGQVVIAGAPTFTLDYYGDGLIQFAATSKVTESSDPSRALVENDGTVSVDGGDILITANAAASVVEEVINTSGVVEARSFAVEDGTIVLMGGDEGIVNVAGSLDASGAEPDAAGGTVDVLGDKVLIADNAHINTSGPAGGGQVHVGGDLRGEGDRQTASQTIVMPGAQITADATDAGNGGQVVVWADGTASIHGEISAKGGAESGDGGFIETSGKNYLDLTSSPDASAPKGVGGTWLIDPHDITIVSVNDEGDIPLNAIFSEDISESLSSGTNVTLDTSTLPNAEQQGNITQKSGATITMSNSGAEEAFTATLTMNANNSIFLNGTTRVIINDLFRDAHLNVKLTANSDDIGGGAIVMNPGSQIITNGGNVTMSGVGTTQNIIGAAENLDGILIDGATISSNGGDINLTGVGLDVEGGGVTGNGIYIRNGASINSGVGNISLNGTPAYVDTFGEIDTYSILATDTSEISSSGTTTLVAGSGDIIGDINLDNTNNDFSKVVINSARDVTIADVDGIELGDTSISGGLFITADTDSELDPVGITVSGQVSGGTSIGLNAQENISVLNTGSIAGKNVVISTEFGDISVNGFIDAGEPDSASDFMFFGANNGTFSNSAKISINRGSVSIFANALSINSNITASGKGSKISLEAACCIEQDTNSILTAVLLSVGPLQQPEFFSPAALVDNTVRLNGPNKINVLTVESSDSSFDNFEFVNDQSLLVSEVTAGTVRLDINGTLTLEGPIKASSEGDAIVIHANRFINLLVEETALQTDAGRFLVFSESTTPDDDLRGNLDDISQKFYNRNFETDYPENVPEEGNFFLYDINAILSVEADSLVVEYGKPIDLTGFINPSGLIGDDSLEESVTGEADFTLNPDLRPDVPVSGSPYVVFSERGTLESPLGYQFEFVNGELTITPAPLTMILNGATREYGEPNDTIEFNATYDGFKFGQGEADLGIFDFETDAIPSSPVAGNLYDITVTGFENDNYFIDEGSTTGGELLFITRAPLTMDLNGATREYGEPNDTIEFNATYDGFKLGQGETDLGIFDFETDAIPSSPVAGNLYDITVTGFENDNYFIDEGSTTGGELLFITRAPLTMDLNGATREYGEPNDTIEFNATYDGFKLGQGETDLGIFDFETDAIPSSPVAGNLYDITVTGFENDNYFIDEGSATGGELLTITPAPLVAMVMDASREYGDPNPDFDATFDNDGFKLGQDKSVLGEIFFDSASVAAPVAGSPYPITVTGFENTNYLLDDDSISGDLTITPALLTITADDKKRSVNEKNPDFTVTYEGFKLDEGPSVVNGLIVVSDANLQSLPGNYSIRPLNATASNYSIQNINGILKVSTGQIEKGEVLPKIQPTVPLDNTSTTITPYDTPPGTIDGLITLVAIQPFNQQANQQLNPELNKLVSPKHNLPGDQQDDLLFSNDGNHELWGR